MLEASLYIALPSLLWISQRAGHIEHGQYISMSTPRTERRSGTGPGPSQLWRSRLMTRRASSAGKCA
eukprot:6002283-Pyramimonas_sp.AAC.1